MPSLSAFLDSFTRLPFDHLLLLAVFAAMALAAFAIHAVVSIAKRQGRD